MTMKNKFKKILNIKSFILIILSFFCIESAFSQTNKSELINFQSAKLRYILEMAEKYHYDSLDIAAACDKAFDYLLKTFDPQSEYYTKEMSAYLRERYAGVSVGIGIDIIVVSDTATVASVAAGSPAEAAGLRTGDRIVAIDLMNTIGMKREEILNLLQGDENTEVELAIHKFPKRNFEKKRVQRSKYDSPSIPAYFVINGQKAAYVQLNRISEKTPREFTQAIENLNRDEFDYFILDLRNNPGGYLGQASEVVDHFLTKSKIICKTNSKTPDFDTTFFASSMGLLLDLPVAVLIDSNSASGAEIIAGAIQDNDRGLLVGMATYGKASAQKFFNMVDSSAFRLTVAHYMTPLGREIQRKQNPNENVELDPTARLQLDDKQFSQISEMLKMHGGLRNLPIFTTPKGRKVFGGGGILPDYFVQYDTTTVLTRLLRGRAIMLTWAMNYIEARYETFENEYNSFEIFDKKFNFTNDDIVSFANFCVANNIWNADMFKIDRPYILYHLKSLIAYVKWGTNEYNMVMVRTDPFIRRALELRQEAISLINN